MSKDLPTARSFDPSSIYEVAIDCFDRVAGRKQPRAEIAYRKREENDADALIKHCAPTVVEGAD